MNDKLISFLYDLEKSPRVVSFLLENGSVVSGKFATPRPPSTYFPSEYEYNGLVLLKSVTVAMGHQPLATLPELRFPQKDIRAWALGKVTAITPTRQED